MLLVLLLTVPATLQTHHQANGHTTYESISAQVFFAKDTFGLKPYYQIIRRCTKPTIDVLVTYTTLEYCDTV